MRRATVVMLVSVCALLGCKTEQPAPDLHSAVNASAPASSSAAQVPRNPSSTLEGPDPRALPPAPSPDAEPLRSRAEMVERLGKLREGMPMDEARALLGEPDDIQTKYDPGGLITADTREIWAYGTRGHLSFATLGRVTIDARDRVQHIYGQQGSPPDPSMMPEGQLRAYLRVIDRLSSYNAGAGHDALALIRAVNALQPLGKDKALALIAEYLRVASPIHDPGYEGVMLLLRLLFTAQTIPAMHVGMPAGGLPEDGSAAPLFPLVVVDDIPVLVVEGYILGGSPEPPSSQLDYFREHGRMREALLRPGQHPERVVAALEQGPLQVPRSLAAAQILGLTASVYQPEPGSLELRESWGEHARRLAALSMRWDGANQEYRGLDGSRLAPPDAPSYMREIWAPEVPGVELELILERQSPTQVLVIVEATHARARAVGTFVIAEHRFELELRPGQSSSSSAWIELERGRSVSVSYASGGERWLGPSMTP